MFNITRIFTSPVSKFALHNACFKLSKNQTSSCFNKTLAMLNLEKSIFLITSSPHLFHIYFTSKMLIIRSFGTYFLNSFSNSVLIPLSQLFSIT